MLVIPGATSTAQVIPFWRAALAYEPRRDSPAEWVPHEHAEARIAAALAAGGRLVRDEFALAWWTLADAVGNEVDIATTRGRE